MGNFFNTQIMTKKRIPDSKAMEGLRKEYNANLDSTKGGTEGTLPADGWDESQSQLDVPDSTSGLISVGRTNKKATRKTRRDKGSRRKRNNNKGGNGV